MNRVLGTCGTIPKSLTFALSEFQKEWEEYGVKILFEEATSPVVQWLKLWVEGTDLISGQGTKILCGASKKKNFF